MERDYPKMYKIVVVSEWIKMLSKGVTIFKNNNNSKIKINKWKIMFQICFEIKWPFKVSTRA